MEKLRRERINSSIEILKSLLAQEFLKQQPDTRLEKADILEMTVDFLRKTEQQQHHKNSSCSSSPDEGYSRCVQDIINYLSQCPIDTQTQRRLLNHFLSMEPSIKEKSFVPQLDSPDVQINNKEESSAFSSLWRPW